MTRLLRLSSPLFVAIFAWLLLPGLVVADAGARAPDKLPPVFQKSYPESIDDLRAIQEQAEKVVAKVMPSVVSVRIGPAFGSGVIVSKDGYILTAGHVSGTTGRDVTIYFYDGKKAKGKTLGGDHGLDSGMIKITTPGEWPFLEMGNSAALKRGQWCLVCAHPGGFKKGRTPPVRVGRLLYITPTTLTSDCILVGGDSGGPLFDMQGRVIGINSRIGNSINSNMHVPVNPFRDNFDKLAKGDVVEGRPGMAAAGRGFLFGQGVPGAGNNHRSYIGISFEPSAKECVIREVAENSPAEKAGLKAQDVILKIDGKEINSGFQLAATVWQKTPGARVALEVRRGDQTLTINVEIGKR